MDGAAAFPRHPQKAGAAALKDSGLTLVTVCQCNPCVIPHLKDGHNQVTFEASGQAVIAAGGDPASFGGEDLLSALEAGYAPATGEYGNGEAFTQALAIQGLVAAGATVPAAVVSMGNILGRASAASTTAL